MLAALIRYGAARVDSSAIGTMVDEIDKESKESQPC